MILSLLRICDLNYTRNSEIQHLLDEREEILKLELKMQEQELQSQPRSPSPVSPLSVMDPIANTDDEAFNLSSMTRPAAPRSVSAITVGLSMDPPTSSSDRFMAGGLAPILEGASSSAAVPTSSMLAQPETAEGLTEMHANMAMIADGSRYTPGGPLVENHQLPPYSPGNQRTMSGHGDESNEIRLSEYVKGETRAQDMKDGGSYQ